MTNDLLQEIRFAKTQQWLIATATMTLLGAVFGAAHTMAPLGLWEKRAATVIAVAIAASGAWFLIKLHLHLYRTRRIVDGKDDAAWRRGSDVLWALVAALITTAVVVIYYLWRS